MAFHEKAACAVACQARVLALIGGYMKRNTFDRESVPAREFLAQMLFPVETDCLGCTKQPAVEHGQMNMILGTR